MSTVQQNSEVSPWIQEKIDEIRNHCSWHGELTGIEAEALLRKKPSYSYLLRQGEKLDHFYLTYVNGELFQHLPFKIDYSSKQFFYQNYYPHFANDLAIFIPEIMHKEEAECFPQEPFGKCSL